jgi:hypothetical protein
MMRAMNKRTKVAITVTGSAWWWLLALSACGGGKQAQAPTTCPDGTVLSGEDCVSASPGEAKPSGEAKASSEDSSKGSAKGPPASAPGGTSGDSEVSTSSYDKEAVEAQLKRAAKQVRANCGSASDEEGAKTGPWGSTTATIVLGRNGHIREVTVPAPYSGKPVGECVVNSFRKIQYPPYNAARDASINWDIQIVEPKQK